MVNVEDEDLFRTKSELKILKSNFQRLEKMYHESSDEVNRVKSEYEARIVEPLTSIMTAHVKAHYNNCVRLISGLSF